MTELLVKRLTATAQLPTRAHPDDAGWDLYADETLELKPGERAAVATGIAVAIPQGCAGFVQPRSGSAIKQGLGILNSPGLIDAGYRGEVKVIVVNLDRDEVISIQPGQRIAQLVILRLPEVSVTETDTLPESGRGAAGFGSTG